MQHRTSRAYGFTLIELLVVIGIIAVLIAILVPVLSQARYSARIVTCASNLRQISVASFSYASDNGGHYPNTDVANYKYRGRVVDPVPVGLAKYTGGSTDWRKNRVWACPEAEIRVRARNHNPTNMYALYYNSVSSLYNGIDASLSYSGYGYIPTTPVEAMRRVGQPRIFKQRGGGGETVRGWQSRIVASDVSMEAQGGIVEAGHMRGGTFISGGYSPLRSRSADAICTANFAFEDGSVRRASYTGKTYRTVMATANGGPFDWDSYILPRDGLTPYP